MSSHSIILPSKPRIVKEDAVSGVYEIDGLYPGYGHTLGNSLRRIILSSIPGASITSLSIDGVKHEFSSIDGIKEDVIAIILNLKRLALNYMVMMLRKQLSILKELRVLLLRISPFQLSLKS